MRILVTNDDGIDAPGLHAVTAALVEAGYGVTVAAPRSEYSGSGTGMGSIADGTEVPVEERSLPGLPDVPAVALDAPPAFAVFAACTGSLGVRPDLVVSGVNEGWNTARVVLASSTVGATLMAGALGIRGLAVSAGFGPAPRYDTAAAVAVATVGWMVDHSAPSTVLNLNVPDVDLADLRGVAIAPLAPRGLMGLHLERAGDRLRLRRFDNTERLGTGTDSALVRDGWAALSVLTPVTSGETPAGDPAGAVEQALSVLRSRPRDGVAGRAC